MSMEILFRWAEEEPYTIRTEVPVDPATLLEGGSELAEPPRVEAVLSRERDHYEVNGCLSAWIRIPCSRCLELFPVKISREIHMVLLPQPKSAPKEDIGLDDRDMNASFYSNERIVLEDIVSEHINLSLPMRPLCRPDCRGLCSGCGADLNRGTCMCRPSGPVN